MKDDLPEIPESPDSERAVISAMLLDPGQIARVRAQVKPSQFFSFSHREPFEALLAMSERGAQIDPVQLLEELRRRGTLDKVGGPAFVAGEFIGGLPSQIDGHVARIVEVANKRKLWQVTSRAAEAAKNGVSATEIARQLQEVAAEVIEGPAATWPNPRPLPDGLRLVPELPAALIPEPLRPWLEDVAERLQVPVEYPTTTAIVSLASVIGSQMRLRPKRQDDWAVTPNLWGAIVGPPSSMKSPAISEALRPLYRLVREAEDDHKKRLKTYQLKKEKAEIRKLKRREDLKRAAKKNALDSFEADIEDEAEEPVERRYLVNDSTVEKYGELLSESPNGLLYYRDELTGWLRSLDDERRANDRAFFLEAWNGAPYAYDRIGRGSLKIANTTTSIFGGIQPSPLTAYLRGALAVGGDDGLLQRFQMAVYPDPPKDWREVDRWPETSARNKAFEVFSACANLEARKIESQQDEDGRAFLRFDEAAQEFFYQWHGDLMRTLRAREFAHPLLESHFGKYPKLMPSLALIFHLSDVVTGKASGAVSLDAAQRAAAWVQFVWAHAQRIYGLVLEADAQNARTIARRLQAGELEDGFTAREVARKGWAGLSSVEMVRETLDLLETYSWLATEEVRNPAGGRPTVLYRINPKIREVKL